MTWIRKRGGLTRGVPTDGNDGSEGPRPMGTEALGSTMRATTRESGSSLLIAFYSLFALFNNSAISGVITKLHSWRYTHRLSRVDILGKNSKTAVLECSA